MKIVTNAIVNTTFVYYKKGLTLVWDNICYHDHDKVYTCYQVYNGNVIGLFRILNKGDKPQKPYRKYESKYDEEILHSQTAKG